MSKPSPQFKWDESALKPAEVTIDFSDLTKTKDDKVTFYELPRTDLVEFVAESLEKRVVEEIKNPTTGEVERNDDGSVKTKTRPFRDVEAEHSAYFFKYLAVSSRGAKDCAFFQALPLTVTALDGLVDMLLKMNHVEEVLATSGNWLMLPTIKSLFAEADPNPVSDPPAEILPAQ